MEKKDYIPTVDEIGMKWLIECAVNQVKMILIPYSNDGCAYLYMIAEYSVNWIEERGMYVDKSYLDIIFNQLIKSKDIVMPDFDEPHEAFQTNNFQLDVFKHLLNSGKMFVRKFNTTDKSEKEIFKGDFILSPLWTVRIRTPKTPDLEEIIKKYRSPEHKIK